MIFTAGTVGAGPLIRKPITIPKPYTIIGNIKGSPSYPMIGIATLLELYQVLTLNGWFPDRAQAYLTTAMLAFNYYQNLAGANPDLLITYMDLYKITNNSTYSDLATQTAMALMNDSYAIENPGFYQVGVDDVMRALGDWARFNGTTEAMAMVANAFNERWSYFWQPMAETYDSTNFFEILKGNTTNLGCFYFCPDINNEWDVGQNSYYLCAASRGSTRL